MSESLVRQKALITAYQCINKLEGFSEQQNGHIIVAKRELKIALDLHLVDMGELAKVKLEQLEIPFTDKIISSAPEQKSVSP